MDKSIEQPVLDFFTFPPVGKEDWRYTYQSAVVRVLHAQMFTKGFLHDLANAQSFEQAIEMLASTEYAIGQGSKDFAEVESMLLLKRAETRKFFSDLVIDKEIIGFLRTREDFTNMRLALRRKLTDKPIGTDYIDDGSVPAEEFRDIFEQENYAPFPEHMQEAIESAVLAYYQNKNVRDIDYALDVSEAEYRIKRASELGNVFLLSMFRVRIDLTNIRTVLRLKFTESQDREVFLPGGFIEIERLKHALDIGYEAIPPLFFATPYFEIVESGVHYLTSKKSFLRLEQRCDQYMNEFLMSTFQITAGPQPVIAYFLLKEDEIRRVRLLLTAKKNGLDARLVLDRIGE